MVKVYYLTIAQFFGPQVSQLCYLSLITYKPGVLPLSSPRSKKISQSSSDQQKMMSYQNSPAALLPK